tara:strand:+ start:1915 stop:2442 length:528 start_codon:yes stop_codon:yes gene_type:complete
VLNEYIGEKMEHESMSKIKLKVGSVEIEFEGSEEYMKDQLPTLVELLCTNAPNDEEEESTSTSDVLPPAGDSSEQKIEMTTNSIATKLNVKTGSDLIIAACAHLCLVKGHNTFTRKNILAEMQTASNFYTKSHVKNLSRYFKAVLTEGKLIERSQDNYALSSSEKSKLESTLSAS